MSPVTSCKYSWVLSQASMRHGVCIKSHVTYIGMSCHIYECVMSHTLMSHVTNTNESGYMRQCVMALMYKDFYKWNHFAFIMSHALNTFIRMYKESWLVRDSFIWYDMTHWHAPLMYVTWLFTHMPWRIDACHRTHSYLWCDSLKYVTRHIHIYGVTY